MAAPFRSGNGAPCLDLMGSLVGRYRSTQVDTIGTPAELDAWLEEFTVTPGKPATPSDVRRTQEVREALHRLALAVIRGEPPTDGDVEIVNHTLATDRPLLLSLSTGRVGIEPPADVAEAVARLTRDAVELLSGPDRDNLHACGDETCSGIFLDRTGRRRWCTDERCGNRMRVRAHREARRAERSGDS